MQINSLSGLDHHTQLNILQVLVVLAFLAASHRINGVERSAYQCGIRDPRARSGKRSIRPCRAQPWQRASRLRFALGSRYQEYRDSHWHSLRFLWLRKSGDSRVSSAAYSRLPHAAVAVRCMHDILSRVPTQSCATIGNGRADKGWAMASTAKHPHCRNPTSSQHHLASLLLQVWQQSTQVPWSLDWKPTSQLKILKSSKLIIKLRLWNLFRPQTNGPKLQPTIYSPSHKSLELLQKLQSVYVVNEYWMQERAQCSCGKPGILWPTYIEEQQATMHASHDPFDDL